MKRSRRRMYLFFSGAVLLVGLLMGSMIVYAAMTVTEKKTNQFQLGNMQTEVSEVFTETTKISPGQKIKKEVKITNSGTMNQFVRVMLFPEVQKTGEDGSTRIFAVAIGKELIVDINTTNWVLGEDGYYYYTDSVKPGSAAATPALFSSVMLKAGLDSSYTDATTTLLVKAEAVNCNVGNFRDAWWQGQQPTSTNLKKIDEMLTKKSE